MWMFVVCLWFVLGCLQSQCLVCAEEITGLNFVAKTLYAVSQGPHASAEPHKHLLLTATGISAVNNKKNSRLNTISLEEDFAESKRALLRSPPNFKELQQGLARIRVDMFAAYDAESLIVDERTYLWRIGDFELWGRCVELELNKEGTFPVWLEERFSNGSIARTMEGTITSLMIRRELSQLKASDKRRFFEAARTLYTTNLESGRARFGAKFLDMQTLWVAHNMLAVDGMSAEELAELSPDERHKLAAEHSRNTHSYAQPIHPGADLEVDGDTNQWHKPRDQNKLLGFRLGAITRSLVESSNAEQPLMISEEQERSNTNDNAVAEVKRSSHNVLVETGHSQFESNYGTFALLYEDAIRAVDPSVSVPFWDQTDDEGDPSRIPTSTWREKHKIPAKFVDSNLRIASATHQPADAADSVLASAEGGDELVEVETAGKWAYFPIITDTDPRGEGKDSKVVYKGFKVPILATEPIRNG